MFVGSTISTCPTCGGKRVIDAPDSVLEERRKPVNIATINNHSTECLRRIEAAGYCTCGQQEEERGCIK